MKECGNDEELKNKDLAFYSAGLNVWYVTRLEKDKSLLNLSVAGIGLLITLITTLGVKNFTEAMLFGLAILAFVITSITIVYIFGRNATHIENVLADSEEKDVLLEFLDSIASKVFIVGIVFTLLIGINSLNQSLQRESKDMTEQDNVKTMIETNTTSEKKSISGADKLKPKPASGSGSSQSGNSGNGGASSNSGSKTTGN